MPRISHFDYCMFDHKWGNLDFEAILTRWWVFDKLVDSHSPWLGNLYSPFLLMVADEDPQEILLLSHFATTWIYFMRATSRQRKILPDSLFKITNLPDNFFVLSEELSHHLGHSVDIFLRHLECPEIFQSSRNFSLTINIRQTVDSDCDQQFFGRIFWRL